MIAFFDIEADEKSKKISDYGCVLENGDEFHDSSIKKFAKFIKKTNYYCGHNIINHDVIHVNKKMGYGFIQKSKCIDTLFLSTLLFPNKPYHKLIKNDKLKPEDSNNPLNDSKSAMMLFQDEIAKFKSLDHNIQKIFYSLLRGIDGFSAFFNVIKYNEKVTDVKKVIIDEYEALICENCDIEALIEKYPIELCYSLALLNTEEKTSLFPEWVIKNFSMCEEVILLLRSTPCKKQCSYCREQLDPQKGLKKFFDFDNFKTFDDMPLQELAVEAALKNKSLIAVFPTGGGKSITYQLPALMSGENTRSLTVVISPLQSLMKDQVDNLEKISITKSATINGLLDPIERAKSIERVKNGDVSILYIAPESLRSKTIESLLLSRDIARFVIDEAHCFSSWGQDFRVDYLYIGKFIKMIQDKKNNNKKIPVSCFTATAKQKVIFDIEEYFKNELDLEMHRILSNSTRKNLQYKVYDVENEEAKYNQLRRLIDQKDCPTIIYASRRKKVELIRDRLIADSYNASMFHGGMEKEEKIIEQNKFMTGETTIMVATSAFGMGVDKKDVGAVIHYDISDSLENYVQESGRAGRDENMVADCYVLYNEDDLDRHFDLINNSKLNIKEIQQIWSAIKRMTSTRKNCSKSALEIARTAGWDEGIYDLSTRVTTAIAALEDSGYLERKQNSPRIFANSIMVENAIQAEVLISKSRLLIDKDKQTAMRIIKSLLSSKYSKRSSDVEAESRVDYLSDQLGLDMKEIIRIINIFKEENILADLKDLVCYIKRNQKVNTSTHILNDNITLEKFIICELVSDKSIYNVKELNEKAMESDIKSNVKMIKKIINYLDIMNITESKKAGNNLLRIKLILDSKKIQEIVNIRVDISEFILNYLYSKVKKEENEDAENIEVQFSINELKTNYNKELRLFKHTCILDDVEASLYYLQKIEALKIEGGFLVLYSPMNIARLEEDKRKKYTKKDYEKLETFYKNKVQQVHIVGEYAIKMVEDYNSALIFVDDYFKFEYIDFLNKYFKGERRGLIEKNITQGKFEKLFGDLSEAQLGIIKDKENTRIVVAAGPGSGKTRLLVHKLASILYTEDIRHEQLLMLTFSRSAVTEFKTRLLDLIGPAAHYVDIKTFHSYCFDILGRMGTLEKTDKVIEEAIKLINDNEVDETKITKMVLVIDEAQDMDEKEYELVTLLIEKNENLRVIAVGDDDQNIFEFRGSSSEYLIKIKEQDASFHELPKNYRSKKNLVAFSNIFVEKIKNRMKTIPIISNYKENGMIHVIKYSNENMIVPVVNHILESDLQGKTCVLTRTNAQAMQITGLLNKNNRSAQLIQSNDEFKLTNMIELRFFLDKLTMNDKLSIIDNTLWNEVKKDFISKFSTSTNLQVCTSIINKFEVLNQKVKFISDFKEYLNESNYDDFIDSNNILVSTFHKAKGREFDNVIMVYDKKYLGDDAEKRLMYVGMTRAKTNLYIHYTGDFFDKVDVENINYVKDDNVYEEPDRLVFQLAFRDVNLGYFRFVKNTIESLTSGDDLGLYDSQHLAYLGRKVLKFSKAYSLKLEGIMQEGYGLTSAKVKFLHYWYDRELEEEFIIVIPELTFDKIVIDESEIDRDDEYEMNPNLD